MCKTSATMIKRSHYLTALLLALWLPSQALATVLVHCVTSDTAVFPALESSHSSVVTEDCHGKHATDAAQTTDPVATNEHHDANVNDCFHCTGGCHKIQHMLALEREAQRTALQTSDLTTRSNDLAAGFPDFPIRPPKTILSV